jgi:hypothetical protein
MAFVKADRLMTLAFNDGTPGKDGKHRKHGQKPNLYCTPPVNAKSGGRKVETAD